MDVKVTLSTLAADLSPVPSHDSDYLKKVDLWNIVSVLRGPDEMFEEADELKHLTTARIRSIVGLTNLVLENRTPLNDAQKIRRSELLSKASPHFRSHYQEACESIIKIYNYDLRNEGPAV